MKTNSSACPMTKPMKSIFNIPALLRPVLFRPFSNSQKLVNVVFIDRDGTERLVQGSEGTDLLHLAHENDIDLEGACEGSLACSTCHVILEPKFFEKLPEPVIEEEDMLDLAFGLTRTSRLGCQVKLTPELEGMRISLPNATRNMAVDGFKPKPH